MKLINHGHSRLSCRDIAALGIKTSTNYLRLKNWPLANVTWNWMSNALPHSAWYRSLSFLQDARYKREEEI